MIERLRHWAGARVPTAAVPRFSAILHGETVPQEDLRRRSLSLRTRHLRRRLDHGLLRPIASPQGALLGRPVTTFHADQSLDDSLMLVVAALETLSVPYALLEVRTMHRRVVIVAAEHAETARRALSTKYRDDPVYVAPVVDGDVATTARLAREASVAPRLTSAPVLRVFQVLVADRRVLGGAELGCDLEFWGPADPGDAGAGREQQVSGTIVAPRPNRRSPSLSLAQRLPVDVSVGDQKVTTYEGLNHPHLLDVDFPVDVIYTWVDGSDPDWARRKDRAWEQVYPEVHHKFSSNLGRFASHDELRYSLRSLEMFAGWVRTIHLVTDSQIPAWLHRDHPKIHVVDHRELFGGVGILPTFNSHAIESRLHHIDGLAEHFMYLNDDVFFGRPVPPELFFHANGLTRFFMTTTTVDLEEPSPRDLPISSAAKRNRALIEKRFERTITHKLQHVAHPLRRDVLLEMGDAFPDDFTRTASAQFRSPGDISVASSLAHYFGYATGRAVPGELAYRYCDIADDRAPIKLQRLLRDRDADVFCLNEVDSADVDPVAQAQLVRGFLGAYFPLPSSFERVDVPMPATGLDR